MRDHTMNKIKRKLNYNLSHNLGVRARDIYDYAEKNNIDKEIAKKALSECYPFLVNKSWPSNTNPRRNYLVTRVNTLGMLQVIISTK